MGRSPAAEIDVSDQVVRRLLRQHAPSYAELPVRHVAHGWDNDMFRVGDLLVMRMPRRAQAAALVEHEARALPRIAAHIAPVGVPRVVHAAPADPDDDYPWAWNLQTWEPGQDAHAVDRADRSAWAPRLGTALARLHALDPREAPENPFRGVPLTDRDAVMRERLSDIPSSVDRDVLHRAWADGLDAARHAGTPALVHGDVHAGNLIVSDTTLSAIVDWGDITGGDPAVDLASAWTVFDARGRHALRAAYGRGDSHFWRRARAWASSIAAAVLAGATDDPPLTRMAVETVREIAADGSGG